MNKASMLSVVSSLGYAMIDGQRLSSETALTLYKESNGRLELYFKCHYTDSKDNLAYSRYLAASQLAKMKVSMSSMSTIALFDKNRLSNSDEVMSIILKNAAPLIKCSQKSQFPPKIVQEPRVKKIHNVQKATVELVKAPVAIKTTQKQLQFIKTDKMEIQDSKLDDSDSDDHWVPKDMPKLQKEKTASTQGSPGEKQSSTRIDSDDDELLQVKQSMDLKQKPVEKPVQVKKAPKVQVKKTKEAKIQPKIDMFFKKS